jgi:hypothetical protein
MNFRQPIELGSISRGNRGSAIQKSSYAKHGVTTSSGVVSVHHEAKMNYVFHRLFLPDGVDKKYEDAIYFWAELEDNENHINGLYARTIEFSLDRSFSPEAWEVIADMLGCYFTNLGWPVQVDIHETIASDGNSHPHLHAMVAARKISSAGFAKRKGRDLERLFRGGFGAHIKNQVVSILESASDAKFETLSCLSDQTNSEAKIKQRRFKPHKLHNQNEGELIVLNCDEGLSLLNILEMTKANLKLEIEKLEASYEFLQRNVIASEKQICVKRTTVVARSLDEEREYSLDLDYELTDEPSPSPSPSPHKVSGIDDPQPPMKEHRQKLDLKFFHLPRPSFKFELVDEPGVECDTDYADEDEKIEENTNILNQKFEP